MKLIEDLMFIIKRRIAKDHSKEICNEEKLYINEVLKLIEIYKFDRRVPLSDILNTMKQKPKLLSN